MPKYSPGIMVAGGIFLKEVGKLIFISGTMNTFSYMQSLEMYKNDVKRLNDNLYFQQETPLAILKKNLWTLIKIILKINSIFGYLIA